MAISKKKQEVMNARQIHRKISEHQKFINKYPNQVDILDKSAFEKKSRVGITQNLIDAQIKQFKLNEEQERAFCIVANHAVSKLNMYLGGMGGTGKSMVLKALQDFFKSRGESYRMIVVAPTGAAAALLGGSTYHSVFGINSKSEGVSMSISIDQVCSRLDGVNYVFLDEVSMLSCIDIYKISEKL
ncbi:hypothetical protein K435DRAFT_694359, partial [Dendrothele bispora CBS 962.96]